MCVLLYFYWLKATKLILAIEKYLISRTQFLKEEKLQFL